MGYASALTSAPRQAAAAPARSLRARTPSPAPCGNQAQLRRLQTKLKVGAVNDPLEHEADRVADQVMRMPVPGPATSSAPLQVSRKCAACAEEEKLQKKEAGPQAAAGGAPASVHETLRSTGQPLDAATRSYFEPRFGRDFGGVRVHTDASAAQSAREVNAHAYTVGHNIAFDSGRFAPGSQDGRRLIAHELAHVVQQGQSGTAIQRQEASKPTTGLTLEIGDVCVLYEKGEEAKSHTAKGILDVDVGFEGFIGATCPEFYGTGSPDAVAVADFEVDSGALRSSAKSTLQTSWVPTYKPGDTLEFIGYSDCVGPEGNNVSLREKRAKAVADLFPSATRIIRGAPIHEYLADGTSQTGRALNRSVVIRRPEPPPPVHKDPEPRKREATIKMEEPPTKDCSEDQREQLSIAYPAAKLMAQRALAAFSKRDSVVDFLLERYFGPDALKHLPEIRAGFSKILNQWKDWDTSFDCEVQSEKFCSNDDPHKTTLAYVMKKHHIFSPNEAHGSVHVCEKAFGKPDDMQKLGRVVLHELSHRLDNTDDHKYCWADEGWCPSLDTKEAIDNADSYAGFAQDYFNATL